MAKKSSRQRSHSTLPPSRPTSAQSTRSNDSNATQPMIHGAGYFAPPDAAYSTYGVEEDPRRRLVPNVMAGAAAGAAQNHHQMAWPAQVQGAMLTPDQPHFSFNGYPGQVMPHQGASFALHHGLQLTQQMNNSGTESAPASVNGEGSRPGSKASKKKKGSTQSEENERELREVFEAAKHRSLKDIAEQIRKETENEENPNPKAEKTKQAYGLIWLERSTTVSDGSVPRGRVYSAYAQSCSSEFVPLLNPASFGKLVRIIWPNIETRRLGNRGESKYHYVRMAIVGDNGQPIDESTKGKSAPTSIKPRPSTTKATDTSKAVPPNTASTPSTAPQEQTSRSNKRAASIFFHDASISAVPPKRAKTMSCTYDWPRPLRLPVSEELTLPDMTPYLPKRTDEDAANNLQVIYRHHCLLISRNFRFVRTAQFMENIKTFYGLFTVPSQKLLNNPQMAPWIEACETLKYRRMIPLLRNILVLALPSVVLKHVEEVANNLCPWILKCFGTQPQHLLDALLGPARAFVKLIQRFMRVNRTARDANDILASQETRDDLWGAWARGVDAVSVVEEACDPSTGGHHRLLHTLTQESRLLLQPSQEAHKQIAGTLFDDDAWKGKQPSAAVKFRTSEARAERGVPLDPLVRFMMDIPQRYPGVGADEILSYVTRIMSTVTRNLMLNQAGTAMQHWMTVSIFMTEFLHFQAEVGGFDAPGSDDDGDDEESLSPYESVAQSTTTGGSGSDKTTGDNVQDLSLATPATTAASPANANNADLTAVGDKKASGQKRKHVNANVSADANANATGGTDTTNTKTPRHSLGGETAVDPDEIADFDYEWPEVKAFSTHLTFDQVSAGMDVA